MGFCVHRRSYLLWSPVIVSNLPFRGVAQDLYCTDPAQGTCPTTDRAGCTARSYISYKSGTPVL